MIQRWKRLPLWGKALLVSAALAVLGAFTVYAWLWSLADVAQIETEMRAAGIATDYEELGLAVSTPEVLARWEQAIELHWELPELYEYATRDLAPEHLTGEALVQWEAEGRFRSGHPVPQRMRDYYASFPDFDAQMTRILALVTPSPAIAEDSFGIHGRKIGLQFLLTLAQLQADRCRIAATQESAVTRLHELSALCRSGSNTSLIEGLVHISLFSLYQATVRHLAVQVAMDMTTRHILADDCEALHTWLRTDFTTYATGELIASCDMARRYRGLGFLSAEEQDAYGKAAVFCWRLYRLEDWRSMLAIIDWSQVRPWELRRFPWPKPAHVEHPCMPLSEYNEDLGELLLQWTMEARCTITLLRHGEQPPSWGEDLWAEPSTPLREWRDAEGRLLAVSSLGPDGEDDGGDPDLDVRIVFREASESAASAAQDETSVGTP